MNKKLLKFAAGLLVGFICSSNVAFSQSNSINVVTTAVPFLRISPDARAGGMGDVGISTAPDASSGFYNLSKVPFAKSNSGIALNYTPWLRDITKDVYLVAASGYYKLDDEQAINMGVRYFNMGNIDFTDAMGNPIGSSRPREFGVDFGYTRKLTDHLSMGVALRYINSSLAKGITANGVSYKAGTSVAGDISLYNDLKDENGQGFAWGFAVTNLGSKIGYTDNAITKEFIPANLGLGGSYTWVVEETSKFSLTADFNKLLVPAPPVITGDSAVDNAAINDYHNIGIFSSWFKSFSNKAYSIALGAEFNYNDQFFARAGYYYETQEAGDRRYFTAGVGVKYNFIGINFSYLAPSGNGVTRNPLSNTLRLGLTFDLDKSE
jgi:hypothetical protein